MAIQVSCRPDGDQQRCDVTVSDRGGTTRHTVRVSNADLARWGRGRTAEQLVKASFAFLLQRESKESILRQFDLSVIRRYFPEYDG